MKIGLIDVDGHSGFPNLALMKLSAWHKAHGDSVEWYQPMFAIEPFAQPYRDFDGGEPTNEQKRLARWCNMKAVHKTVKWEDYK